jgi:uncharacterized protein (TIRG00374 family)
LKLKSALKFLFFLSIGIFLIWLSVHKLNDHDKGEIQSALQRADYKWLVLSMIIGVLSHVSRAMRWKMLMEPLGFKPKTSNTFFAVMIGYLTNYALPRLGEVSRCGVLSRYEKVPFTELLGTVIVERLVDVITFLIVVCIVLFLQFDTMYRFIKENIIEKLSLTGTTSYFLIVFGLLLVAGLFIFRKNIIGLLGNKARHLAENFIQGIQAIGKVKSAAAFIGHSVFIWFVYYITFHMCFFALPETSNMTIGQGLTIFLVATLTIMVTPGGLGAFPLAVASVLTMYSINYTMGTAIGWLVWLSQFVSILFLGLLSLILLPLLNKEQIKAVTQ